MGAKGKILVVDDDRLVLAMVTHGLSQAGYEVIDADNGDDAILLARQHRPDIALLDIRMEGKTGFDVAEYLREVGHTPFVFLSAFSDDETVTFSTGFTPLIAFRNESTLSFIPARRILRRCSSCSRAW